MSQAINLELLSYVNYMFQKEFIQPTKSKSARDRSISFTKHALETNIDLTRALRFSSDYCFHHNLPNKHNEIIARFFYKALNKARCTLLRKRQQREHHHKFQYVLSEITYRPLVGSHYMLLADEARSLFDE